MRPRQGGRVRHAERPDRCGTIARLYELWDAAAGRWEPAAEVAFSASGLGKSAMVCDYYPNGIGSPGGAGNTAGHCTQEVMTPMCSPDYIPMLQKKPRPRAERRANRLARGLPADLPSEVTYERGRTKARTKARYESARALINGIKLARGCADCGYRAHPAALQFDHLPGTEKTMTIGQLSAMSNQARLLAEIEKCEVVCANCHAIRETARREARRQSATEGGGE